MLSWRLWRPPGNEKRISVPVMMLAGGRGAAQFVRARPWTWFFYMAASFPYLWLHSSYSAIRSMKLLQVSLTKIFNAFPAYWIPVVLTILLVAFSFVFSYTIPFPVHDDGKREKYPSAGAPDTGKTRAA